VRVVDGVINSQASKPCWLWSFLSFLAPLLSLYHLLRPCQVFLDESAREFLAVVLPEEEEDESSHHTKADEDSSIVALLHSNRFLWAMKRLSQGEEHRVRTLPLLKRIVNRE
jgi:hypothetical protein